MRLTIDPHVVIEDSGPDWVVYNDGLRRWKVSGVCNQCGLCEVGAVGRNLRWDKEPGQPYACVDLDYGKRLDIPVSPLMKGNVPQCTLEFEWLDSKVLLP